MTIPSRLFALLNKLPPAQTYDVIVDRDVAIAMDDDVVLLADRYYPRDGTNVPTVLVRSPYGRRGVWGLVFGRIFAERGFGVLIQSVRGTAGSGGTLDPFRQERDDGLATVRWLKRQPWFDGRLATCGLSYLGHVQWAIADAVGPELKAMSAQVTSPDFRRITYPGTGLALSNELFWMALVTDQRPGGPNMLQSMLRRRPTRQAEAHLPLRDADRIVTGKRVHFWQDWLEHSTPGDEWWEKQNHWPTLPDVAAPAYLLGGWYDLFLPDTLRQYEVLRDAGRNPRLVVGPWIHGDNDLIGVALRDTLAWFRAHILGDTSGLATTPVRVFVMGANEWRDYADWPPPGTAQRWHLHADRRFAPDAPAPAEPDRFRYDPADPTPAVGGPLLSDGAGPKDQRVLEARPDVLTYTSAVLEHDMEVIGPVRAEVWLGSDRQHTDLFVSLCDVDEKGVSINICDGLQRLRPIAPTADGVRRVEIDLFSTAHCFRRGHRLRVQVSSGAHPRWARNTGTGEPLADATTLMVANQAIYHDPARPSALLLAVANT